MTIHWFPGHMSTARNELRKVMPDVDMVIEVLDARLPFSSENPLVSELRGQKPCIQILNKSDLADPAVTTEWMDSMVLTPGIGVLLHQHKASLMMPLTAMARKLVRSRRSGPLVAMILGIPNVGKSTLINGLAGRPIAKTANKPGLTRVPQRVKVGPDLILLDSPGLLWPRLSPVACAFRLAISGAISDRVLEYEELTEFAIPFLRERYPQGVIRHYSLDEFPAQNAELLEAIARRRGFLGRGGFVDITRAAERLILDLREGKLGPLSLERPADCRR
jgi:ribosome biogenesis GTPase A